MVDPNSITQIKQLVINFVQLVNKGQEISSFDEREYEADMWYNKSNYNMHEMP